MKFIQRQQPSVLWIQPHAPPLFLGSAVANSMDHAWDRGSPGTRPGNTALIIPGCIEAIRSEIMH
jgi:hypothetical protein